MLTMTKYDVEHLIQYATRKCASFLKISNVEWKGARELLDEIGEADAGLCAKLTAFIDSYQDWFSYTECLIEQGGATNEDERRLVLQKMEDRDSKRSELIVALGQE